MTWSDAARAAALEARRRHARSVHIKQEGPGAYKVSLKKNAHISATVVRNTQLRGANKWVTYANFDKYLVADPMRTKGEASWVAQTFVRGRMAEFLRANRRGKK